MAFIRLVMMKNQSILGVSVMNLFKEFTFTAPRKIPDTIESEDFHDTNHPMYQDAINAAYLGIENANRFTDSYYVCDPQKNGWRISCPRFENAYAQIVVNGQSGKAMVYFSREDARRLNQAICDQPLPYVADPAVPQTRL